MKKRAQKVYDLKLLTGQIPAKTHAITKDILNNLISDTRIKERYDNIDEAKEVLEEYRSIARLGTGPIIIEAYALEELEYESEEYISTGVRFIAPFDESSIITEEV